MEATPFRTISIPSAPAESSVASDASEPTSIAEAPQEGTSSVKPGLSIYEEVEGKPYTSEYFNLNPFMQDADYSGLHSDVYDVDQWVRSQIKDKGLTDTTDAYAEIIAELDHSIGAYKNEEPLQHFKRVAATVKALNRMAEARVKPVLDTKLLTPTEYEMIVGAYRG